MKETNKGGNLGGGANERYSVVLRGHTHPVDRVGAASICFAIALSA